MAKMCQYVYEEFEFDWLSTRQEFEIKLDKAIDTLGQNLLKKIEEIENLKLI